MPQSRPPVPLLEDRELLTKCQVLDSQFLRGLQKRADEHEWRREECEHERRLPPDNGSLISLREAGNVDVTTGEPSRPKIRF